jgi:tetratricopeptide (TPR) repeat protein
MHFSRFSWFVAVAVFFFAGYRFAPSANSATADSQLRAADNQLRGAQAILQELSTQDAGQLHQQRGNRQVPAVADAEFEKLAQDIAVFAAAKPLPPADAAKAWLQLAARWRAFAERKPNVGYTGQLSFSALVRCLPQPEAWPFIAAQLQAAPAGIPTRNDLLLGTFAAFLCNNDAAFNAGLDALSDLKFQTLDAVIRLKSDLLDSTADADVATDLFRSLGKLSSTTEIEIPDLVERFGEEKASALLREALAGKCALTLARTGARTAALTRRLALETMDQATVPRWQLAESLDAGALFQALERRFGTTVDSEHEQDVLARTCCLLGLIARGQIDDAIAFSQPAQEQPSEIGWFPAKWMQVLRSAGKSKEVYTFCDRLFAADPTLPNWENYLSLATNVGRFDGAMALVENMVRNEAVSDDLRQAVASFPWKVYLALNDVDDGLRVLRADINEELPNQPLEGFLSIPRFFDRGLDLANLGRVLHQEVFKDEGLHAACFFFVTPEEERESATKPAPRKPNLARLTAYTAEKAGRPALAEDVLRTQLLLDRGFELQQSGALAPWAPDSRLRARLQLGQRHRVDLVGMNETRNDLVALAGLYSRQHRPADVVALLDHAVGWKARDVGEILALTDPAKTPLGYSAARALFDLERKEESRRVLNALLEVGCSYDPAYELFLQVTPPEEAAAEFDRLSARDPFEQRPLIWKAEALRRLGRLDEADAAAQAAIAADPSAGEPDCGQRLRAYEVLADVLAAAGKDPASPRSAAEAIHLAGDADDLVSVYLRTRALPVYRKALDIFPDEYCIHARLAVQLERVGLLDEAAEHFQRAFELMPGSLGRAANPCFECDDLFGSHEAQEIGDRVIAPLPAQEGAKPQVFYLLGQLRAAEGRYPEALDAARRAVSLDANYLSAWKLIGCDLPAHLNIPRAEQDAALLNILRLDPNFLHSSELRVARIRDLAGLWKTVAAAQPKLAPFHPACYQLSASAAELDDERKELLSPPATPAEDAADRFLYNEQQQITYQGVLDRFGAMPRAADIIARQESMELLIEALDRPNFGS